MTNFEPIKKQIWESVKTDDKQAFNKACDDLMEKASKDIWRIGWGFRPENIEDVFRLFKEAGKWCHEQWIEAMKNGDAPPEDVSPAESFAGLSMVIKEAIQKGKLPPDEITEWWIDHSCDEDEDDEKEPDYEKVVDKEKGTEEPLQPKML